MTTTASHGTIMSKIQILVSLDNIIRTDAL